MKSEIIALISKILNCIFLRVSKDGGSAFNEAHDFALIVHPVYYRDQWLGEGRFPRFSLCTYQVTITLEAGDTRFFPNVIPKKGIETDSNLASALRNSLKFICSHFTLTGWHLIDFKVGANLIEFNMIDLLLRALDQKRKNWPNLATSHFAV